ncbi:hypothetical protein PAAG_12648 [Paracoccidioides lutzii Pb01]|uniref:Uncharacterized protein n=1 Tax=Paracoccidioides lutzii (strain ATCC MYA-826 / Pb01) TaxID=502779 RepID=A0A0A2V2X3_PARBA|nr:hypothetical protein PAAG_12648 [Paracoccidioides lutzii Pb01]KGQ00692.1 hypothetical protein PAAG_12648 [Paracoccidioides lutzii Pb01]
MSRLPPTPQSERKRSLHSHSKAQETFPTLYEEGVVDTVPTSGDEGETKYALVKEAMEEAISTCDTGKGPVRDESEDDGTPSPNPGPIPIPTPNANGMITMTTADLLTFCQQMMTARENARMSDTTPAYTLKQEIREYHKEVQASMDTKTVTTFDGTNYQAWRIGILADAEVIGATDILMKNQHEPPEEYGTNQLDKERWTVCTKALYH